LPVVFIIENNNYAMGTSVQRTTNVHELYKIGLSYDMPSKAVDGMSVEDVHDAMVWAVDRARKGDGPSLLEMKTYRFRGHSMSDPGKYRTKEEVESYKSQDPIEQVLETLRKNKWITEAEIEATEDRVKAVVEESVVFAEESPYPTVDELYKDVYVQDNYPYILD
jgi:pyruvate dehydrogenase E1 component alpha subunit